MKEHQHSMLEFLRFKNICHAVCVGLGTLKKSAIDEHVKDYYIITMPTEYHLKKHKFGKIKEYPYVLARTLTLEEIEEFKKSDEYIKVLHTKYGRVYELKNDSFGKLHRKKYKMQEDKDTPKSWGVKA